MTVVDPLATATAAGGGPTVATVVSQQPTTATIPPHAMAPSTVQHPSSAAGSNQVTGGNSNSPLVLKTKEEILTSLHLIKDIRRLETYQRDFFLKVKESLTHVQLLLDHQLMDMAWSDNLIDCEESLLKASVHLQSSPNSSSSQISELYSMLLADREKLNRRFQELSIKSSLSEYVVNSRALLDVATVHRATEAILRNETPQQAKADKTIPVDHAFFLANFCTTSIASTMVSSSLPDKRDPITGSNNNAGGFQNATSASSYDMHSKKSATAAVNYYGNTDMNNGNSGAASGGADMYNGAEFMAVAAAVAAQQQKQPSTGDLVGKNHQGPTTPGRNDGSGAGGELVAAISQITRSPSNATAGDGTAATSGSPAKAGKKAADNLWIGGEDSSVGGVVGSGSAAGAKPPPGFVGHNGYNGAGATGHVDRTAVVAAAMQDVEIDKTTDASQVMVGGDFDSSKPLSFARIASLNLEKQAIGQQQQQQIQQQQIQQHQIQQQQQQQQIQHQQQSPPQPSISPLANTNPTAAAVSSLLQNTSLQNASPAAIQAAAVMAAASNNFMNPSASAMTAAAAAAMNAAMPHPTVQLPPSSNPRYFFDLAMEGKRLGRVVIEVQPTVAPKMAQNFGMLVTGEKGFGYKGCQFFQAWKNESVICGDWEHNSGRGGRAALDGGPLFTPDETRLPCIRGAVGMRRMSKKHSSLNQVASQFRIILANMNTQFTGIFGHIIYGIEALDMVANIGGEGGRPEKVAIVANCGVHKI